MLIFGFPKTFQSKKSILLLLIFRKRYGGDPKRIILAGESAGGNGRDHVAIFDIV
jgi:acetyl esterase/lipase